MNKNVKQKGKQMNKNMKQKGKQKIKSNRNLVAYSIMKLQVSSQTDSELGTRCITLKFVSKLGNGHNMNF